jgi:glycerate-2-kinase
MKKYITNFDDLAITKERKDLLNIIEAGYKAIDTTEIINTSITLDNKILKIKDQTFDLNNFENVYLLGFGKASSVAVLAVENILKETITKGMVMDKKNIGCKYVKEYLCTHPLPSPQNVVATKELIQLVENLNEKDLVIIVVSGGGSAMLCSSEEEYQQGAILYTEFLKSGGNITELNTLRKHLSQIKGGGLAKLIYPATIASLIFCDVPGDHFEDVASGTTYKDKTAIADAEALLKKYNISSNFNFNETPKEDKYFEKVYNIPLVSNTNALIGMEEKIKELGYEIHNMGAKLYQDVDTIIDLFLSNATDHSVVIGAGEPSVIIKKKGGITGRCEHFTMKSLLKIKETDTMSSFASDGTDNLSISAGAIADTITKEKAKSKNLSEEQYIEDNKIDEFFKETGDQIITGETGSNVSDVMILLRK